MTQVKAICWVLLTFHFNIKGTVGLSEKRVCFNGMKEICCSNFEMIDGVCKHCQSGFNSVEGERCIKCPYGWSGYKCAFPCHCKEDERCDNIIGCVNSTTEHAEITPTDMTTHNALTSRKALLSYTSDRISVTVSDNSTTKPSKEIIIYCMLIACMLLVVCLGFAYHRYRLKQQSKKLLKLTEGNSEDLLMEEVSTENEQHYHYIDESRMVDSKVAPEPSGGYLEVVDSSSDNSIQQNIDGGYLHPYNALLKPTEAEVHIYLQKENNQIDFDKSSSSESNSSLPYTDNQGYFHMYHKLKERCKSLPKDYERPTLINHIKSYSNNNYNINHQSRGEENVLSKNCQENQQQPKYAFGLKQPQNIQEAKQILLKSKPSTITSCYHQNKTHLTL